MGMQDKALQEHYRTCRALEKELTDKGVNWEVRHIHREYKQTADALANAAPDNENGNGPSEPWQNKKEKRENKRKRDKRKDDKSEKKGRRKERESLFVL